MATPTGNFGISGATTTAQQPSRTWNCDQAAGRIQGEIDGFSAVKQAVEIILSTERYRWQIYRPSSCMEYDGLIGYDPGFVFLEVQRRVKDALSMDERVTGADSFTYAVNGGVMEISFTVHTVYGSINEDLEVTVT